MNFYEFRKEHDKYGAYFDWKTISEAKKDGSIPEKYGEFFPDRCVCGSENIITSNLKRCMCCNPRCEIKEACKLSEMMRRFGFKGFGEATCATILRCMRAEDASRKRELERNPNSKLKPLFVYGSYVETLAIDYDDYPQRLTELAIGSEFFSACVCLHSMSFTFPQLVSCLGIPALGSNALQLLKGIDSFDAFLRSIEESGGLRFFCAQRGVHSEELMNSLYDSLLDIGVANCILGSTLRHEGIQKVDICITGRTILDGHKYTKNDFIKKLNEAGVDRHGVQLFEFRLCAAVQSAPFIVYSQESSSAKFVTGRQRGSVEDQFGRHDVLIKADDLYDLIKQTTADWSVKLNEIAVQGGEE